MSSTEPRAAGKVTVAATQMSCSWDTDANLAGAESLVRRAADEGANIVLIQELFAAPYFCKDQLESHFDLAETANDSKVVKHMQRLAEELAVVLPVSFFEKHNNAFYNSLVVVDADGEVVSHYRKSHIPDGPGYQEKYYFSPGDTGFKVAHTRYARIGVAICWDQWFPEAARVLALQGAELLFYPTAIGSEPVTGLDSREHWRRTMQGHAAANMVPVIASNRIGSEQGESCTIDFYGYSFIADNTGAIVKSAGHDEEAVLLHSFDLQQLQKERAGWGMFRDRRPDLYGPLLSLDGGKP